MKTSRNVVLTAGLLAVLGLAVTGCTKGASPEVAPAVAQRPAAASDQAQRIEISVTPEGFVPAKSTVRVGQPVTLVVTRKTDQTCAKDIVVKNFGIKKALPLNEPVEVTLTPTSPGPIRFACAMDMVAGELLAQ